MVSGFISSPRYTRTSKLEALIHRTAFALLQIPKDVRFFGTMAKHARYFCLVFTLFPPMQPWPQVGRGS
jgi:hypothetical protein